MQEHTGTFGSQDQFFQEMEAALAEESIVAPQVTASLQAQDTPTAAAGAASVLALKMDVHLTTNATWVKEFQVSSPAARAIMLSQLMDAFNDGVEGIHVSFSEPVVSE